MDWIWIVIAAQAGFIVGFVACSLMRMAAGSPSDEELDAAAREYYKP